MPTEPVRAEEPSHDAGQRAGCAKEWGKFSAAGGVRFAPEGRRVPLRNRAAFDQARTGMAALMNGGNDDQCHNERDGPSEDEKYELVHRSSYSFGSHCRWLRSGIRCALLRPYRPPRRIKVL